MSPSSWTRLFSYALAPAAVLAIGMSVAEAATSSSSGTDSGSGSSGTAGTMGTSGGTSTGGDTESGSSSGGLCGERPCMDPGIDPVTIDSPADGAVVTSPVSVTVSSTYRCSVADCGSFEDPPASVTIQVFGPNDMDMDIPCDAGQCTRELVLTPGEYTIGVNAQYTFSNVVRQIEITVEGPGGSSTGADGTGAPPPPSTTSGMGTSTGTTEEESGDGGGCSCRSTAPGSRGTWPWLVLALGLVVRRRAHGSSR